MPRVRLTFYAETLIPWSTVKRIGDEGVKEIASRFRSLIFKEKLVEECVERLRKLQLVGEWLLELWYYEILEDRYDLANGMTKEKAGINIWFFEWVTTAVPLRVIEMEDRIRRETTIRKKLTINNTQLDIEAYLIISEED